ncbi:lactonase family protein [Pseudomonas sp. HR96]|uniref:lactonase family protein n=1 Tax=Pseudomonas sp. HR96 TaxID=1027966 RepID=UPI002A7488F9|nr:lactonase family protein [Pseudomonas sp. HR96]WPO98659.1 lactonase family protein [Pseudomonas sp. HR96]
MKKLLLPLVVTTLISSVAQADLLVGTYTAGTSQGIYRYAFDSQTGQIAAQPTQTVKSENPSWLTLSHDQKHLFAVNENGPGQADVVGRVSSFAIDASHAISPINEVDSKGDEPTHSSLAKGEGYLFVSNYAVHPDPGGRLSVLPVKANGELGEVIQQEAHEASKVNPERQASSHVHSVVSAPNGHDVYLQDLGADRIFLYKFDPKNAAHPLTAAKTPEVILAPGSGPRHLTFSKDGKHAYLTLEMAAQVAVFDVRSDGFLIQKQLLDMAKGKPQEGKGGGAIHLSPDGKFLYATNRGNTNELIAYAVAANGQLKEIQRRSVEGKEPREFTFDPSGKFLLIANQKSSQIVVVRHDAKTGKLGETVQKFDIDTPSDLKFLAGK